jgi:hypothetical protein
MVAMRTGDADELAPNPTSPVCVNLQQQRHARALY